SIDTSMQKLSALFAAFALLALPAYGLDAPDFSNNAAVTASILNSTVTNSTVNIASGAMVNIGGNSISGESFKNATGIIAISQNSGINSNTQQSVTFHANNITLAAPH